MKGVALNVDSCFGDVIVSAECFTVYYTRIVR